MTEWFNHITREFAADLSRLWIASDPDNLLLDEIILSKLNRTGFEVLPFEDPIVFRAQYEERFRNEWDKNHNSSAKALILHVRDGDVDELPWDYLKSARIVKLSLADLLPNLSYPVIRKLASAHHEALFKAYQQHTSNPIGDKETKTFLLVHIFRFLPSMIDRPEDFWRELLRLHYRAEELPIFLAQHAADSFDSNGSLSCLPLAELFADRNFLARYVQNAWESFLLERGATFSSHHIERSTPNAVTYPIPFEHPDVRVIIDNMFLEGLLEPVSVENLPAEFPAWAQVGTLQDANAVRLFVVKSIEKSAADTPDQNASYRSWLEFAEQIGALLYRFHRLTPPDAMRLRPKVQELLKNADERLKEWCMQHYEALSSLPASRAPVMLHHVPRFLSMRRKDHSQRIALLVFDGLALDQWAQIREFLDTQHNNFLFEEFASFAWLPTLTAVSRQALFSGRRPREFAKSIDTTSKEPALWSEFWKEDGLRQSEIHYRKSLKRVNQLAQLEDEISNESVKVSGVVVDMIDEFVHGAHLGKRGLLSQITDWCQTGFVDQLFRLYARHGYQIYVTSDHGNLDAEGAGRLSQGAITETSGERVRIYRSRELAATIPEDSTGFKLELAGLPADFVPFFAEARKAFVRSGDEIVAHGGISIEELIVPFVRVRIESPSE